MHESRSTPHVLATWLHRAPDRVVLLTIHATRRRDPFDAADAQALQRVTRHIARALEIRDQLGLLNARMNALGQVLEHGHGCYLLLDARGAVVESSSAARSLLAKENNSIACDPDGQLSLSAPADRDFRQWISTGHAPTAASPGFLAVPRPDAGSPLRVMLAPLNHVPVAGMDNAPRWLLSIADPDLPADKPLRTLRNLFGLSEREAEIATLIASGMRPAAAAARMGIALNTARTHLKHVFQKSGAASQAELVRLVLRHSQGSSGV
jgi:DNA-binding CsgD family transcriptional regulator